MEQFKQTVHNLSDKDLTIRCKELSAYAQQIGKKIPTITDVTRQQTYLKEYTTTMEKLNIVKAEMNHRGLKEKISFLDKIKSIFKKKKDINIEMSKPIEAEQPKQEVKQSEVQPAPQQEVQPVVAQSRQPERYEEETDVLRSTDILEFLKKDDFQDINELSSTSSHKNDNRDSSYSNLKDIVL